MFAAPPKSDGEVSWVGLREMIIGSASKLVSLLFLLGEVGRGESSLLGERLGESAWERRGDLVGVE